MDWCFVVINGKLAEIYSEYLTKREQQQIKTDIKKVQLKYANGKYTKIKI